MEVSKSEAKTYSLLQKTEDGPMCVKEKMYVLFIYLFIYLYVYINSHVLIRSFYLRFFSLP